MLAGGRMELDTVSDLVPMESHVRQCTRSVSLVGGCDAAPAEAGLTPLVFQARVELLVRLGNKQFPLAGIFR